jgi:3-hydroxy-3-methylglutaryl CoA synthase
MRFVLCIVVAALLSAPASAATMSIEDALHAAAAGDRNAVAAVGTTTNQRTCLRGCANRGYSKSQCDTACEPGLCHTDGPQPYCVGVRK